MISLNKNYRKRYEYCFLLKHDHPWGSTFVDYKVTTDIRTDISHAKIFSLYPLCILAKPFLISFKQTLGQSTKYWPKTNYKSIQQHFKNIHRTEVRHLPDKVRSMFNLSIFVHIWHNSGTDTGRHADIQFL